jgi:hypothetical protein
MPSVANNSNNLDPELIMAIINNNERVVLDFISRGISLDSADEDGNTALIWACLRQNREQFVNILLEAGANPNLYNRNSSTALIWAAKNGSVSNVTTLLGKGADINHRNSERQTALLAAMLAQQDNVVAEFLGNAMVFSQLNSVDLMDYNGHTVDLKYVQWLSDAFSGNFHCNPPININRNQYQVYSQLYSAMWASVYRQNIKSIYLPIEESPISINALTTEYQDLVNEFNTLVTSNNNLDEDTSYNDTTSDSESSDGSEYSRDLDDDSSISDTERSESSSPRSSPRR